MFVSTGILMVASHFVNFHFCSSVFGALCMFSSRKLILDLITYLLPARQVQIEHPISYPRSQPPLAMPPNSPAPFLLQTCPRIFTGPEPVCISRVRRHLRRSRSLHRRAGPAVISANEPLLTVLLHNMPFGRPGSQR